MRTLKFKQKVHLSENFGGIEHGESVGPDIQGGATHELKSDDLADHLVKSGYAEEIAVEKEAKPKKEKKEPAGGSTALTILLILGLFAALMPARADIYSTKAFAFTNTAVSSTNGPFYANASTNLLTTIAASATLTVNSDPIPIRQKGGLALLPMVLTTTNVLAVENVTNGFDLGVLVGGAGGTTNWTTTHPLKSITKLNGTNAVVDWNLLDNTEIDNVAFIRWAFVSVQEGHTNSVTILPLQASQSLYAP